MELFDCQEYAAALQRDATRMFRQAEQRGLTREQPERPRARWFGIFGRARGQTEQPAGARVELSAES